MEIDWKYDNIKNGLKLNDLVTFNINGVLLAGIVIALCDDCVSIFRNGCAHTAKYDRIIAYAGFDDTITVAKPKPKFPDGALTWDEIKELSYDDVFLWVYFDDCKNYYPAILDVDGKGDTVIVWCASDSNNWLREDGYGKDYVCYLNKPDEG